MMIWEIHYGQTGDASGHTFKKLLMRQLKLWLLHLSLVSQPQVMPISHTQVI